MHIGILTAVSLVSFLLGAFFAAAETAIIACDRIRLRHLQSKGDHRAKMVLDYIGNPEHSLSVVLVGTNLGVIGCTATFTAIMISLYGHSGTTIATLILVPLLLLFEEIIPKGIFLYYADKAVILSIYPLRVFAAVLFPIIRLFAMSTNALTRVFKIRRRDRRVSMTKEELLFHLRDSRAAGLITKDTMTLASRAFHLKDLKAGDVMLPLQDVVMIEQGQIPDGLNTILRRERFSRYPVYSKDIQNIVGILSVRSLLKALGQKPETPTLEDPYIVGVDTPIVEMLIRMKNQGCHMAMIRAASGRISGMATLEDIIERLVGAVADEFH
jgi:putative hemolysin